MKVINRSCQENGITLIALVVTIVVLLILAAVSIGMLTGENGLITRAQESAEETRGASVEEERDLWKANQAIDEYTSASSESLPDLINRLVNQGLLKENEKDQILGNEEKGIEATGQVTIGSRTIVFGTGGQTLVEAIESGEIKIGDYVNFTNPTSGSYPVEPDKVGLDGSREVPIDNPDKIQNYEITASKNQLNWRVLGVENGKAKLIAGSPLESDVTVEGGTKMPYLIMYGAKSYTDGYKELDNICNELYGSLPLVSEARSVNLNDVNQITGVTSPEKIKEVNLDAVSGGKQYGEAYSFANHYTPESWLNGKQKTTVSDNVDGYYYAINSQEEGMPTATVSDQRQYDMLFKNVEYPSGAQYWLASRGVFAYSVGAVFGPGMVFTGDGITIAGIYYMFYSDDGGEDVDWAGVRPVVILDSEVTTDQIHKIEDQTDPVWNYEFEEGGGPS